VKCTNWIDDADSNLKEVASQVSHVLTESTLGSIHLASLASVAVMSQGAKCLAMERIRQKVNEAQIEDTHTLSSLSQTDEQFINCKTTSNDGTAISDGPDSVSNMNYTKQQTNNYSRRKYHNRFNNIEDLGAALAQLDEVVPKSPVLSSDTFTQSDYGLLCNLKSALSSESFTPAKNKNKKTNYPKN